MGSRQEFNVAHIQGALIAAATFGGLTGSCLVFEVTLVILIVRGLYD